MISKTILHFIVTVKNDIHNIKAALKCLVGGQSRPESLYLYPTSLETDRLFSAFLEEKFYGLKINDKED